MEKKTCIKCGKKITGIHFVDQDGDYTCVNCKLVDDNASVYIPQKFYSK